MFDEYFFKNAEHLDLEKVKFSDLNLKDFFWSICGSLIKLFFIKADFSNANQISHKLKLISQLLPHLFSGIEKLDFNLKFLLFVFETFLNFCNIVIYNNKLEKFTGKQVVNLSSKISMKTLFLTIQRSIEAAISLSVLHEGLKDFIPKMKIFSWKGFEKFSLINVIEFISDKDTFSEKIKIQQDLLHTQEYLFNKSYFVESKMIEKILSISFGISEIEKLTRQLSTIKVEASLRLKIN